MVKMSRDLINSYQNLINYSNADSMFAALDQLLKNNGREFLTRDEYETEEECVRFYVLRSNAMRFAADAIEHYAKAILIQNGHTWDESKTWGHNLLDLFLNLDEESRYIVEMTMKPIDYHEKFKNDIEFFDGKDKKFNDGGYIKIIEVLKDMLSYPSKEDYLYNNSLLSKYNYKSDNKIEPIPSPTIQKDNIVTVGEDQTIEGELGKLNPHPVPGQPKEQVFGIKSRFPGQYFVEGNAEFLVSLAYTLHAISDYYRERELNPNQGKGLN